VEPLRVGRCLREGWRLCGRHWGLLTRVWLLVAAVWGVVVFLQDVRPDSVRLQCLGLAVSIFVFWPLYVGQMALVLALARGGPCGFCAAFRGFRRYWKLVGVYVVLGLWGSLALAPGLFAFLVSGAVASTSEAGVPTWLYPVWGVAGLATAIFVAWVMLRYCYAGLLLFDQSLGVLDSLRRSAKLTRGSLLRLFTIGLVTALPAAPVAALASARTYVKIESWVVCIVGTAFAVVVGPWMSASQVVAYRTLCGEVQEGVPISSGDVLS